MMSEENRVKEFILGFRKEAQEHMRMIKEAEPLTFELLDQELQLYVFCKFQLRPEEVPSDNFDEIARYSLSHSMKVSKDLVKQFDLAKSCDGTSSLMAKKVLLFMAIQRELGIEIPARESAEFVHMKELSMIVWKELEKK